MVVTVWLFLDRLFSHLFSSRKWMWIFPFHRKLHNSHASDTIIICWKKMACWLTFSSSFSKWLKSGENSAECEKFLSTSDSFSIIRKRKSFFIFLSMEVLWSTRNQRYNKQRKKVSSPLDFSSKSEYQFWRHVWRRRKLIRTNYHKKSFSAFRLLETHTLNVSKTFPQKDKMSEKVFIFTPASFKAFATDLFNSIQQS